ncbi:lipase family protein [Phytohabitans sp. ZYX-F-186]|uniref:Lipase family protein n=1 Tax=Phytohabitans maris TaxID=3071409 RepID=A0ABU0ZF61_9ACTN|nr:lipase family protein [Phytohabitans sp. ZYX-F-186]MDQ7905684.1 lipase family protein [Phytohabitans sp. ZYX-F-186]
MDLAVLGWAWRAALGVLSLALGFALLLRPFDSLTLLIVLIAVGLAVDGVRRLVGADRDVRGLVVGGLLLAAAVLVVAWPAISVSALAVVVGVSFLVNGVLDLAAAAPRRSALWGAASGRAGRVAALLSGAALVIFGALALIWPDVTILVIGIGFGVRMIVFGASVIAHALRDGRRPRASGKPLLRVLDLAGRGLLLALALALLAASMYLHRAPGHPTAFYSAPREVPAEPGRLIRSQPYTHGMLDGTRGWLILYTTTGVRGEPRFASGFVMAPDQPSAVPRQVVLWTHGTEGADVACAPTLLPEPQPLIGPVAAMRQEIARGRVVVGPDYPGAGVRGRQSYLIGVDEGRSSLDAVRAARQLDGVSLAAQTVVWGHSQGGQAAIWTGILAPAYAPEVSIVGIAAAAPASDLPALVDSTLKTPLGQVLGTFVLRAYAETYPDVRVDEYVDPRLRTVYRAMSRRCVPARSTVVSGLTAMAAHGSLFSRTPTSGPLAARLAENVPSGPVAAPLYIAQGTADPLVLPSMQDGYVAHRCATGQPLRYQTYAGRDHLSLVADDSPYIADLTAWTQDRFAGVPQRNTCG